MKQSIKKYWQWFATWIAELMTELVIPLAIGLFALFTLVGLVFYIVLRATKPDFQPLELAILSVLLGGFVLTSGFLGGNSTDLKFSLIRIGALYLVSAIAFVLFGLYMPVDAMPDKSEELVRILGIIIPTSFYVGAFTFTGATSWLLWLLPRFFKRKPSKSSDSKKP